jgi:hypothetical protein
MKKSFIQIAFVLLLSTLGFAQANRDYIKTRMFWSEFIFMGKVKGKFLYQVDYQYRRTADAEDVKGGNSTDIFAHPFQQVVRPWIHYQPNDAIRFSLSPLGWWGTWGVNSTGTNFIPEFRICPQITLNQKLGRITFNQRYRYEFRFFGYKEQAANGSDYAPDNSYDGFDLTPNRKGRFRYFLRSITPLNNNTLIAKTFYINAFDEIFVGIGGKVKNQNLLDQNRFFCGLGYKFEGDFRIELGYLSQTAFKFNNAGQNNVEQNNIIQAFVIFDNFNKFFMKKEVATEEVR